MTKFSIVILLLCFSINSWADDHNPSLGPDSDVLQPALDLRYILKQGKWTYLGEVKAQKNNFDRNYLSAMLLSYYRVHRNWKVGVFVKQQSGAVHDDDWIERGGDWLWRDTGGRGETLFGADVTARYLLGDQTVGEAKLRYHYNDFNQQQSLLVRPGVTHFLLKQGRPYWNLYARLERYVPLNFGNRSVYEDWLYAGGLYHYSPTFKPGAYVALKRGYWTSSEDSKRLEPDEPYEFIENTIAVGLTLTWFRTL